MIKTLFGRLFLYYEHLFLKVGQLFSIVVQLILFVAQLFPKKNAQIVVLFEHFYARF
jgi:hypothetical protein